ncbi:MAG: hypothetical protein IJZ63_06270 [Clostridia bacterium]|nr:hypothetical protein [Clostridia bacterium]
MLRGSVSFAISNEKSIAYLAAKKQHIVKITADGIRIIALKAIPLSPCELYSCADKLPNNIPCHTVINGVTATPNIELPDKKYKTKTIRYLEKQTKSFLKNALPLCTKM